MYNSKFALRRSKDAVDAVEKWQLIFAGQQAQHRPTDLLILFLCNVPSQMALDGLFVDNLRAQACHRSLAFDHFLLDSKDILCYYKFKQ